MTQRRAEDGRAGVGDEQRSEARVATAHAHRVVSGVRLERVEAGGRTEVRREPSTVGQVAHREAHAPSRAEPWPRSSSDGTTPVLGSHAPIGDGSRSARGLVIASVVAVVLCFLAATAFPQWQAKEIGVLSESLVGNAMPSIEHLASARSELRRVQAIIAGYPLGDESTRASLVAAMVDARRAIDEDVDAYLRLPVYPGEEDVWREIRRTLTDVDAAVANTRAYADAHDDARAIASVRALGVACDRASTAILDDIQFNARNGERLGRRIRELRTHTLWVAVAIDVVSVLLAGVFSLLVIRSVTSHWILIRRHNQLLAERADELEQFAGRVAHDIRGPIGAASLSLALVRRGPGIDPKLEEITARGLSSLGRASRFIDGLLAFARAGARAADDAQSPVVPILTSLVGDLRSVAEDARVELSCEPLPECSVSCNPAILELLVANLVRNAIKYMGDGLERKVTVRALAKRATVRVEVEDTGVGVPRELRRSIFEPFVRGPTHGQQGVGLGLSTVKRICSAHGGDVGVDGGARGGSLFWFELPRGT